MFRKPKQMGRWIVIVVAIGLVCSWEAQAKKPPKPPGGGRGPAYTIVPFLPPDFESGRSYVTDLSETGQAVGSAALDGTPAGNRAVHLDIATSVYTVLQGGSYAGGVNNLNQIAGSVRLESGSRAAFWPDPQAAPVLLPLLPGDDVGFAFALSDDGLIVGHSGYQGVVWRVFVDENGTAVDEPLPLPPLDGDTGALGLDLNELIDGSFQVTGHSRGDDGVDEAVVWTVGVNGDGTLATPGPPVSLGTLGLSDQSYANAINIFGDVCGRSDGRPFLAPADQNAEPLPVPRNTQMGEAWDINNLGEIVGELDIYKTKGNMTGPLNYHPYLWKNGDMIDLETQIDRHSGWDRLWAANVINDAGIIAGYGRFDVEHRGFLLIPSEP